MKRIKEIHYNLKCRHSFHELLIAFNITTKHINALDPQWQVFQSLHPDRN